MRQHNKTSNDASELMGNVVLGWISTGVAIVETLFFGASVFLMETISLEFFTVTLFFVLSILYVMKFWSKMSEL
jgi:hypothetical protein